MILQVGNLIEVVGLEIRNFVVASKRVVAKESYRSDACEIVADLTGSPLPVSSTERVLVLSRTGKRNIKIIELCAEE